MIKIKSGTFGYWNGTTVEPKTSKSEPFEIDPKREKELVEMGVAEYVGTQEEGVDADGNFVVDGTVIGHVEEDGVVTVTDPDTIADTLKDINENDAPAVKIVDDVEITVEFLESLKMDALKEFAEPYGVKYEVGMKKADYAQLVFDAIEVQEDEQDENEDDGKPPVIDPVDALV